MNIFGIAGLPRSGKDTLAELFVERGYFGVSLGDIVRDEARYRHKDEFDPISVKNMTETSNYLRTSKGADFALREALRHFEEAGGEKNYRGLVVYSVRAPVEADFILEHKGQLIWVETSDDVRLSRANLHRREGESVHTLEDMKNQEALQQEPQPGIPKEVQMDTSYVKLLATQAVENNSNDVKEFRQMALHDLREYLSEK